jgi:hypothetical protein
VKGRNNMFTPLFFTSLIVLKFFDVIIAESAGHFKCFLQTGESQGVINKLEAKVFYQSACCLIMVIA